MVTSITAVFQHYKLTRYLLLVLTIISVRSYSLAQITNKTEITANIKSFETFSTNPCDDDRLVKQVEFNVIKKVNLLRLVSCDIKDKKFKGMKYFEVVVDNIIYNVPLNNIKFNYNDSDFIEAFKNLEENERHDLKSFNDSLNKLFFEKERFEKLKKDQEAKRQEEAERKKIEEERIEEERKYYLNLMMNDSLLELDLRDKIINQEKTYFQIKSDIQEALRVGKQKGGVLVTEFNVSSNDYGSVGLDLGIFNCSGKRIKYVTFKLQAYNPVDDKIEDTKSLKGIGFINNNTTGSWSFDNVWFSDVLETVKLLSLVIQFEDGSLKTVSDIVPIRFDKNPIASFFEEDNLPKSEIYGSISLQTFADDLDIISFVFFDTDRKNQSITIAKSEIDDIVNDLKKVISSSERKERSTHGYFESQKMSSFVYIKQGNQKGIIRLIDAQNLLQRLQNGK